GSSGDHYGSEDEEYESMIDHAMSSSGDGGSSGDGSSDDHYGSEDEEYESMIDHAMSVYLARSPGLVGRALREAGAEGVAMPTSVDGNDAVVAEDDFEMAELHQAEFAVEAVQRELTVLLGTVLDGMEEDSDEYDEYDGDEFGYDMPYREPYVRDDAEGSAEEFRDASYGDMYGVNPLQRYNEGRMPGGEQSQCWRDDDEDEEDEDMFGFDHIDEYYDEAEREVDREMHEDKPFVAMMNAYEDKEDMDQTWKEVRDELIKRFGLEERNWYRFRYWPMHAWLRCERLNAHERRFYTPEQWAVIRDFYHDFVADDLAERPLKEGERPRTYQFTTGESFDPPTEPIQTKYGRGLAAARDIQEGELVFKATNNTVLFNHPHTWRKWIWALYNEVDAVTEPGGRSFPEYACDSMIWSWIQRLELGGPRYIVLDLDNGSLLNQGRADDPNFLDPNVRCGKEGGAVRHVVLRPARHQGGGRAALRLQVVRSHRRLGGDIALGVGFAVAENGM
ncbi:hypothetical protein THAOC_26556, partial [Thalassiosira oceanica]